VKAFRAQVRCRDARDVTSSQVEHPSEQRHWAARYFIRLPNVVPTVSGAATSRCKKPDLSEFPARPFSMAQYRLEAVDEGATFGRAMNHRKPECRIRAVEQRHCASVMLTSVPYLL
jgi:hypothetical protein